MSLQVGFKDSVWKQIKKNQIDINMNVIPIIYCEKILENNISGIRWCNFVFVMNQKFVSSLVLTRDFVTYSWQWLKTFFGRYNPTLSNDCPWDLFIGVAKEIIIRNCLLTNSNGHGDCDGGKDILRIQMVLPIFFLKWF